MRNNQPGAVTRRIFAMTILFQSHSGREKAKGPSPLTTLALRPAGTDIAVDEQADFGYFVPPLNTAGNYLPESSTTVDELDALGDLMIDAAADPRIPRLIPRCRRC
jgi:hypothetical protein